MTSGVVLELLIELEKKYEMLPNRTDAKHVAPPSQQWSIPLYVASALAH